MKYFDILGKNPNLDSLEAPLKRPNLAAVLLDSHKSLQVVTWEEEYLS